MIMTEELVPIVLKASELTVLMEHSPEETIVKYFELDSTHPYSPRLRLKPGIVIEFAPGEVQQLGFGLDVANWFTMNNRAPRLQEEAQGEPKSEASGVCG